MKHLVFLNPKGIVEIRYANKVTPDENIVVIKQALDIVDQQLDQGNLGNILIDFTNLTDFNRSLISSSIKTVGNQQFHKIAGYGVKQAAIANFIQGIIKEFRGQSQQSKIFKTRAEAEAWLLV